ncbi:hypothetical protein PsorP6_005840 [Peronosclerospora sorghi]|uniref:Uncharacterized protein n=1 Tax=Peronosclerospora sorghi TaxID=230839 RepID=A0ACC0W5M6_9STRA|nr:hypothetical protein PsorP6_005840 [Peronosclerospora sorghi]
MQRKCLCSRDPPCPTCRWLQAEEPHRQPAKEEAGGKRQYEKWTPDVTDALLESMESSNQDGATWYSRYRNSGKKAGGSTKVDGRTKRHLIDELVQALETQGYTKDAKKVKAKVESFETIYRGATREMERTGMGVTEEDIAKGYSIWEEKVKGMYPDFERLDRIMGERVAANPPPDATADDAASILIFGSAPNTGGEGGADAVGSDVESRAGDDLLSVNASTSSTPDGSPHFAPPVALTPHKRRFSAGTSDSVTSTTSKRSSRFNLSNELEKRQLAEFAALQEKMQVEWKKHEWEREKLTMEMDLRREERESEVEFRRRELELQNKEMDLRLEEAAERRLLLQLQLRKLEAASSSPRGPPESHLSSSLASY